MSKALRNRQVKFARILASAAFLATATAVAQGPVRFGGSFDLTTSDGHAVTDADYRGKWLLVYFGYTGCPDVCPTVLSEIGVALRGLGSLADKVRPIFITLDPAHDTPSVLSGYLSSFDPRIVGLRGSPEQTEKAAKLYHVYFKERSLGGGAFAVDHSSFLYVMRPDGSFAELLAGDLPGHNLADALRKLVR